VSIGDASVLLTAAAFAATNLAIRPLGGRLSVLAANATRSTIAAVLCLALLPLARLPDSFPAIAYLFALGSVLLGTGLGDSLSFAAIQRVGVTRAVLVSSSYPLFATALAALLLGERLAPLQVVAMGIIVAGVYLVANEGQLITPLEVFRGEPTGGVLLALVAAMCWAASTVLARPALAELDAIFVSVLRIVASAALLWALAWRHRQVPDLRRAEGSSIALLGAAGLSTAVSTLALMAGLQLVGAARTAILLSTSPLFSVVFAALLVGERITPRIVLSVPLTIGGVWLLVGGSL
jgi:drug/metabolite transporter (DMT)-like permease